MGRTTERPMKSAVDALASALMRARRASKWEDIRYDGPELEWWSRATCNEVRWWWSHEGRIYAAKQGLSLLRVALMLAYQLGFEAGATAARERRFPWHLHGDRRDEAEVVRTWLEALAYKIQHLEDDDGPEDRLSATDGDAAARSSGTDAAPT